MYFVLGIAFYWLIMAIFIHERKEYDWKKSFLLAPVYIIAVVFYKIFGGDDSGSAD